MSDGLRLTKGQIIEIPQDGPPPTLEATLRSAIYAAHAYYQFPIIKCGTRDSIVLPVWEYERLLALEREVKQ
jgi:hypothetical protein